MVPQLVLALVAQLVSAGPLEQLARATLSEMVKEPAPVFDSMNEKGCIEVTAITSVRYESSAPPEAAGAAVSETLCACSIACAYPSRSRVTKRGLSRPFPRRIIHNLANLARSAHLAHLGPWVVLVWRTESSSMNYSSSRLF